MAFSQPDCAPSGEVGRKSFSGSPPTRSPPIPIPARKQKICRSASFCLGCGIGLAGHRDSGIGLSSGHVADSPVQPEDAFGFVDVPSCALTPPSLDDEGGKQFVTRARLTHGQLHPNSPPAAFLGTPELDAAFPSLPPTPGATPSKSPTAVGNRRRRRSGVCAAPDMTDGRLLGLPRVGESLKSRSPSIPIPGVRGRGRDVPEEDRVGGETTDDEGENESRDLDQSQCQFSISCQEDNERRPVIYVPSSSYRRPSALAGSLTSWHQSSSFLPSSSPSAWPSSPAVHCSSDQPRIGTAAVGACFSFDADNDNLDADSDNIDADSNHLDAVSETEVDADGHADITNADSSNADEEESRGPRFLQRRQAVSEVRLDEIRLPLRDDRRASLPARFDAKHPSARRIGVELCRIADEIEAFFIAERDIDGVHEHRIEIARDDGHENAPN